MSCDLHECSLWSGMGDIARAIEDHDRDPRPHRRMGLTEAQRAEVAALIAGIGAGVLLAVSAPAPVSYGASAAVGVSTYAARADHVHNLVLPANLQALAGTSGSGLLSLNLDGSISAAPLTLPSVIVAGSAGAANTAPVITWDAQGRLTAVSTATITPAAIGALSGTLTTGRVALSGGAGVVTDDAGLRFGSGVLTIDRGTGVLPAPTNSAAQTLTISNADNTASHVEFFGFGAGAALRYRSAGGTRSAPTALPDGFGSYIVYAGYDGTTWQNNAAYFGMVSDGLWSGSNRGAYYQWIGTPNGSTVAAQWMTLRNGALVVGTDPGGSELLRVGGNGRFQGSGASQVLCQDGGTAAAVRLAAVNVVGVVGTTSNHALNFTTNNTDRGSISAAGLMTMAQGYGSGRTTAAPAGVLGEIIQGIGSSVVHGATLTGKEITSVTLTPGIWLIHGTVYGNGGGSATNITCCIHTTSAVIGGTAGLDQFPMPDIGGIGFNSGSPAMFRTVAIGGSTTYYLNTYCAHSGAPTWNGSLTATRIG